MWTLFGSDGSGSAAVKLALLRCALPYRVQRASTWEPDSAQQDTATRAQALRGLVFIAANCYGAIGVIDHPERGCKGGDDTTHEKLQPGACARLHGCWSVIAGQSGTEQPFLGDEAPGALALLAAGLSRWPGTRGHLRTHRPALLTPVFARHWPG